MAAKIHQSESFIAHRSDVSTPTKAQQKQDSNSSIRKLIDSRKADTLNELKNFDDEDIVLKSSPKKHSSNSKLSHFRGVSNNGRKWQVMIMGFAKKIYFGGICSELEASKKYDKYAILMHGLDAKTNYSYNKRELSEILNSCLDESF